MHEMLVSNLYKALTFLKENCRYFYKAVEVRVKVVVCELSHNTSHCLYISFPLLLSHFVKFRYFNNSTPNNHGRTSAQAVHRRPSPQKTELKHGKVHVGFLENKVVIGQVFV